MRILFATGNEHKLGEIREILRGLPFEIVSMKEAGVDIDIVEDGATFAENALIKARAVCAASGEITMADDSGLCVDALDGGPGVFSARYMGEDTSYAVKNAAIIDLVNENTAKGRGARFVCDVACVFPDGREEVTEGVFAGEIAHAPAGENGFGYDPIFYVPACGCTSAELSPEDKNAISHRGKALRAMREVLLGFIDKK